MAKKILLVSRNLPPLVGGMERLAHRMHDGLIATHDVVLIGPRGCSKYIGTNIQTVELPKNPMLFALLATAVSLWLCCKYRFDVCIGANGLIGPTSFLLKRLFKVPSIILVHGLDLVIANKLYQWIFVPSLRTADSVVANSQSTKNIAITKAVSPDKIVVINPGVDYPPVCVQPTTLRNHAPSVTGENSILFVGRIVRRKGLSRFIDKCMPNLVASHPGIKLLVVGDAPEDAAKKDPHEIRDTQNAIIKNGLIEHVKFLGKVTDAELQELYQIADVLILPLIRTPNDIEGFGMVALEAAAFGVPTVAFNIGGINDAIKPEITGSLIAEEDYSGFFAAIEKVVDNKTFYRNNCIEQAKLYRWENYLALLNNEIERVTGMR